MMSERKIMPLVNVERRILSSNFEIRSLESGEQVNEGYVVRLNEKSEILSNYWGNKFTERVAKGSIAKALQENTIKALWNHDTSQVLGSTKSGTLILFEDDIELRFELKPSNTTLGNDAKESIRRGDVDVKRLQNELNVQFNDGLDTDGYLGDKSLEALKGVVIKKGAQGKITRIIQERLMQLGYSLPRYGADSDFGRETENVVLKFQCDRGINADMILGINAFKELPKK